MELQEDCFSFTVAHPEVVAKHIKLTDNALEVLERIGKKHDQILISNTKPTTLKIFIKSVGIQHIFQKGRFFAANAHTKNGSKHIFLKKYLKNNRCIDEIIVIGDSPGDIELGKAFNAKTFLYTRPDKEPRKSKEYAADFEINDLRELLKTI